MAMSSFFDYASQSGGGSKLGKYTWDDTSKVEFDPGAYTGKYREVGESLGKNKGFGGKDFLQAFASGMGSRYGDRSGGSGYGNYPWMMKGSEGGGGQILENLGVVYPQQGPSMFLPGQEGKKSPWGQIGGALLGAASGFIPGVGLAGASLGSQLGGGLGSALFD